MTDNYYDERKDGEDDNDDGAPSLYSILNLRRDATTEEIHRSYRSLSTSFHPDKIRLQRFCEERFEMDPEEIQETFLQFKKAHEVLVDPVFRLAYDHYGDYGVELVRRVQQQQREQTTRRGQTNTGDNDGGDDDEDSSTGSGDADGEENEYAEDDDDDEEGVHNLYEKLEGLLVGNAKNRSRAKAVLNEFMEQHDYQQNLTEDNCVHLGVSMTFPPAVPLKPVLYRGRDYLRFVQKSVLAKPPANEEEKEYYRQRILQERRLVDYQISQLRSGQKADVGFTLSSVQPPRNNHRNKSRNHRQQQQQHQPSRWSMAVGCSTDLVYPSVAEIAKMAKAMENQKRQQQEQMEAAQKHPVSAFCNTSYTPNPQTQMYWSANLNNDNESHQYSFGSTHTFSNQTACRYGLTYLARSPLPDGAPIIFSLKSYRHLQNRGTTSVGLSASGTGQVLQWNAKWEGTKISKRERFVNKVSVKANIGLLQGNSIELGYKCRLPKPHERASRKRKGNGPTFYEWLEERITLPKQIEVTTLLGNFRKLTAMVTHEIASMAGRPTMGFGMEHDVSLGRWAWIWELSYNQSTFRIPISIVQLGSMANPRRFYAQRFYYGLYCLLLQSMVAELLGDNDDDEEENDGDSGKLNRSESSRARASTGGDDNGTVKTKAQAEQQLSLMRPVAEKKRYRESRGGLLILTATYWQTFPQKMTTDSENSEDFSSASWVHEIVSMDATVQLQFWVNAGGLSIPGGLSKSSRMGFYDLRTESRHFSTNGDSNEGTTRRRWWQRLRNIVRDWALHTTKTTERNNQWEDPQLTVRYSFRGSVYEITVGDTEPLELPCRNDSAEILGDADVVQ
jgi:curved DNA-binding protein CbpA